jgi:uncharacterized protein (DUF736 family)
MSNYDNTNKGVLFKNERKDKDTSPDYQGKLDVNWVEYRITGWLKTSKAGTRFLSIAISPANPERTGAPAPHPASPVGDDIPF